MNILSTNNLTKKYKDIIAVNNVSMNIDEGDIYGFVGENGAGKTTIIRLITGLINPTSGSFSLIGKENTSKEILTSRSMMSGIVEKVSLVPSFTALDNLKLQAKIIGLEKSDEELISILGEVGLVYDEIKSRKAKNFSLGMRQRLGIAMCLIQEPKFIVLDEPMNGLDPQGFIDVRETILSLNKKGITFLVSSHILSELDKICNKIGFISHGKLVEEISIDDLHSKSRRHIDISSKNNEELKEILSRDLLIKEITIEDNTIKIYDDISINKVLESIVKNDIEIESINVMNETIEDYYINLIGRRDK